MTRRKELETNLVIAIALCVIWYFTRFMPLLYGAGLLVVLSLVSRLFAGTVAALWLGFSSIIGYVNGRILLVIVYLFLLTPIALVFRLLGREEHARNTENSNMVERNHKYSAADLEKLF